MENVPIALAQPASVRVYRTGCVITSKTTLDLQTGDNRCVVDCLPDGVAEDSIRVRMPASASLLSVAIMHSEDDELEERSIQRVRACEAALERVDARTQNRVEQKDLLLALAKPKETSAGTLADYEAFLSGLADRLDILDDQLAELKVERNEKQHELDEALEELHGVRRRSARGVLVINVRASVQGPTPCEIVLRSDEATWSPVYDVLVESFEQPLKLRLRAEVSQSTGVDWQDVSLTLSTAKPTVSGGILPRLTPVRLRRYVPQPAPRQRMMGMARTASMPSAMAEDTMAFEMAEDAAAPLPLVDAAPPQAEAVELSNSVEYEVPGTWSVKADSEDATLVEVLTQEMATTYEWLAVPLVDDSVHMVARLSDALAPETLGHEASVYLEGAYCGKARLEEPPAGKPFEVSLGTDARMRASRRLVRRQASKAVLRGRKSEETVFELVVESRHAEPKRVVVLDQIPVTQEKEIQVEVGGVDGGVLDKETGEVRWELDVEGGSSASCRLAYTVSHPKDMVVDTVRDAVRQSGHCAACGVPLEPGRRFCYNCGAPC